MKFGERQVSPTRDGIRRDHLARYEFAIREIGPAPQRVLDVACGVGYGTQMLARAGHRATGIDIDAEAIAYASRHYNHQNIDYRVADINALPESLLSDIDVAVAFECIEHVPEPAIMLRALRRAGVKRLIASVPNEDEFPHQGIIAFHERHYTKREFRALLVGSGWDVTQWHGQADAASDVSSGAAGRTLVAVCVPAKTAKRTKHNPTTENCPVLAPQHKSAPQSVVILGLGPSLEAYVDMVKRLGARRKLADETWGINAVGDVIRCDLLFHMDDARVQEARSAEAPDSNIAAMMGWMQTYEGRVLTSVPHPSYPCMEAYPLQDVIRSLDGYAYFNSTAAYAVAYAIHLGVKRIVLFGCDFTYANSHHAEKGRACMEFWLGFAAARGVKLSVGKQSSLMDACEPVARRLYGYDGAHVRIEGTGRESVVTIETHDNLPTAEEVEAAYDHSAHPNPLMQTEPVE